MSNIFFPPQTKQVSVRHGICCHQRGLCRLEFGFKVCTGRTWGPGWVGSAGLLGQQWKLRSVYAISFDLLSASVPSKNLPLVTDGLCSWRMRPGDTVFSESAITCDDFQMFLQVPHKGTGPLSVDGFHLGCTDTAKNIFRISEFLVIISGSLVSQDREGKWRQKSSIDSFHK